MGQVGKRFICPGGVKVSLRKISDLPEIVYSKEKMADVHACMGGNPDEVRNRLISIFDKAYGAQWEQNAFLFSGGFLLAMEKIDELNDRIKILEEKNKPGL